MDAQAVQQLISRYWQAAAAQDFDDLHEIFADDVTIEWPQSGEQYNGKEACINIFVNYPGGSPRMDAINRVTGDGSVWVVEGQMTYPDQSQYMIVGIFELSDDKIVHEVDYFTQPFPVPEWRKQYAASE
jgi:ketosteroid isomerase-like protein